MFSNVGSKILIVEEGSQVATLLGSARVAQEHEVRTASSPERAVSDLNAWAPTLIIADLNGDSVKLCRLVRQTSDVPIIIVSEDADERTELAVLDSGADDYLTTPLSAERVLARIRAAIRRGTRTHDSSLQAGEFRIDFAARRVQVGEREVRLTPKEFDLLVFLAQHPNRVLTHATLLRSVWGDESVGKPEYLRVFMGQLRKKLEPDPSSPQYIETEPWVGYRFNPGGSPSSDSDAPVH
jgi:two-component system, OmpR family, KDP operon response regulator KdpE